jgi:hypothetical protein
VLIRTSDDVHLLLLPQKAMGLINRLNSIESEAVVVTDKQLILQGVYK